MTELGVKPAVYIDANVFIDFLQGDPTQVARLEVFFGKLRVAPGAAVTSEFTLAEVLGKEAPMISWEEQKRFYIGLFELNSFIDLWPVTREILNETGALRRAARQAGRQIKLPDAIHLVTASKAGCRWFLTADRRITWPTTLQISAPDDAGLAEIETALSA